MTKNEVRVTSLYPSDLLGVKSGGIDTVLEGFFRHAPSGWSLRHVGVSSRPGIPLRRWQTISIGDKKIDFFPLFYESRPGLRRLIPLSLRFTAALKLFRPDLEGSVLLFNRPEPAILFKDKDHPMVGLVHNDITRQIYGSEGEVLWRRCPAL